MTAGATTAQPGLSAVPNAAEHSFPNRRVWIIVALLTV
jgi:hypothetical protein